MSRPATGDTPGDSPLGDRDTPFGSTAAPFGSGSRLSGSGDRSFGSPDGSRRPADAPRDDDAAGVDTPAAVPSPPPGPENIPLVPDPPAPGTLPPAGVPFTGKERLRRDPGLGRTWLAIVVAIMGVGVILIALGLWQAGSCVIGAGMIVGAVMRFSIPSGEVGLLRVRGRIFDGLWMLAIGIGIIAMVLARS
ncbi:DUF3017 domain-containing protein [Raineyella sp.]|uniref:DUF3017 domain-containing protein n=1 Tax=Raineyella sp. TaxID=1911550 RepID=UPI002B202B6C|nr:DUF3017 domain-containing protein [Raineyella sp.]MEA5155491.1 DUF3017 domain-containing protein [Raineyella sp.]